MTRVYVPTTIRRLRDAVAAGEIDPGEDAVVAEGDDEDSEYAALMTAADVSLELVRAEASEGLGRRVVVVAEIGTAPVTAPFAVRRAVAVHADTEAREWNAAGADPDDDLGWYAVQELDSLL